MARRALKDEMPALVLRGITRAIAKNVVQTQLQKTSQSLAAHAYEQLAEQLGRAQLPEAAPQRNGNAPRRNAPQPAEATTVLR